MSGACIRICNRCGKEFSAESYRFRTCPECKREAYNERARRRYARLHPKEERYCKSCGVLLTVPQAERCPRCAEEWHRELMRISMARKRAEARAIREANKKEAVAMDEGIVNGKRATVKKMKADRARDRDARRKAAEEKKRIAAGVEIIREIVARRNEEKRLAAGIV